MTEQHDAVEVTQDDIGLATTAPHSRTPAMTQTPEQIAASLTKAQREALLKCTPWDVCVGAGIAIAFCANGLLEDSTITDDGVQLSSTGQQVRAILEKNNG